jgi:hypothetical protein
VVADQIQQYAPEMFRDVQFRMGAAEQIDQVLQAKHWQSFNVWRPIRTVRRDPLVMLDTRSASADQLVPASFDRGDGHMVSMNWLKSGLTEEESDDASRHKWYYMSFQQPDEVVAFKIYDSDLSSKTNGTPHTAVSLM